MDKSEPWFSALDANELDALHEALASARSRVRAVMRDYWWDKDQTEQYRRVVAEFQDIDPLFTA